MISINKIILAIPGCLFYIGVSAQVLDVQHYRYSIELSDKHDTIYGKAEIVVKFIHPSAYAEFDLVQPKENGKGMMVLHASGTHLRGLDRNKETEKIKLLTKKTYQPGDTAHFTIHYKGIPADGLIISKTKFGQRSFFADNWPDRGHNWLPCHDDPADKASVEFIVTAPLHYQVVANGLQVEETNLPGDRKLTHWRETVPISTKVMVIGVADFAVQFAGMVEPGIPVYSWVYPQEREKGFYDYSLALEILPYYIKNIGPYPYQKLANVQSKTTFGGLENANTIFYSEGSVTGTRSAEILLAHEIAHQWFGNHATEKAFAHLWLSEGFATYMTILYMENKYGKDTASVMLTEDRRQVIDFARGNNNLVIDSTHDYMQLLNPNSYQKGGWILHMLRRDLGDSVFWRSIRKYFASFGGGTADSKDLRDVFEKISGKNLGEFFNQWLLQPGIPVLSVSWNYIPLQKKLQVKVEQLQNGPAFSFPLELEIKDRAKSSRTEKLKITSKSQNFSLPAGARPAEIKLDPHISLLFEGTISGN